MGKLKRHLVRILTVAVLWSPSVTSAQEVMLAGWHDFSAGYQLYKWSGTPKSADAALSGVTGNLWGGDGSRNQWGSTDGTYGASEPVGTSAVNGTMSLRTDRPVLYFSVSNDSPTALILNRVLFDFASVNGNSPQNLELFYSSGDLDDADGTLIAAWTSILNGLANVSDHEDVEVNLDVLSDQILGPGESATFRFVPAAANNNAQAMSIDNVAVVGTTTAAELRVLTYNIHGGKGPDGEGTPSSNLTAFRNNFMNNEDVLCLQEVDNGDCWTAVQNVFSDYPYRYRTINQETDYWFWETPKETSIAILSKHPFLSSHNQLIQTDPGGDEWERHAQHVTIQIGEHVVDIFNFHNTYNWFNDDYASEKSGLTKFRDNYVLPRLGISSVAEADRLIMLGDFNVLHANVTAILAPPDLKYNGLDHIASAPFFTREGVYATAAADLSDHNAVWASLDVQAPSPDPLTWLSVPEESGTTSIRMTATSAVDPNGVEYYFSNTSVTDGSHDSGWQSSPIHLDTGLAPATTYSYTVKTRDKSANANASGESDALPATTDDGDELPNDWELLYFGDLNTSSGGPQEDWDHDGWIDRDEWIADTDPNDPQSWFQAAGAGGPETFALSFQSSAERVYTLWRSADMSEGSWEQVAGQVDVPGSGEVDSLEDPAPPSDRCFYRVEVTVP